MRSSHCVAGQPRHAPGPLSALVPTPVMFHLFEGSRVWDQVWLEPPTKGVACVGSVHWETDRLGSASGTTALNPQLQKRNKMTEKAPRTGAQPAAGVTLTDDDPIEQSRGLTAERCSEGR